MSDWLDSVYRDYHEWKGWEGERDAAGDVARAAADLRLAGIAPPASLLEIGYGDGAFLRQAHSLGYHCAGLERAGTTGPELVAAGIDARSGTLAEFRDHQFDLVIAFDVFEHIPIADLVEYLRELPQLLTPTGRLLARFPNMASPFGLATQYGDITHVTALSPASFAQVARVAGLDIVKVANASTVFQRGAGLRGLLKPLSLLARKTIELVLSFAYYGKLTPLAPSVVVILKRRAR